MYSTPNLYNGIDVRYKLPLHCRKYDLRRHSYHSSQPDRPEQLHRSYNDATHNPCKVKPFSSICKTVYHYSEKQKPPFCRAKYSFGCAKRGFLHCKCMVLHCNNQRSWNKHRISAIRKLRIS